MWEIYQRQTKNGKPSPLLEAALRYVKGRVALDFGAGSLRDSEYLLRVGYDVIALDAVHIHTLKTPRFVHIRDTFEKYKYPVGTLDLVHDHYAYPFIEPRHFKKVWKSLYNSLKKGGIITGELFGNKDEWKKHKSINFFSEKEVGELLRGYEIISFKEEEFDKKTAGGVMKHWHVFSFIARK